MLVLDAGGISLLAGRSQRAVALIAAFRRNGLWPALVPSVVLVESLTGHPGRDALTNRLLKICEVQSEVAVPLARRAASLRSWAGLGSAVDAIVVAFAEPHGTVLTSDPADLTALAAYADDVTIEQV